MATWLGALFLYMYAELRGWPPREVATRFATAVTTAVALYLAVGTFAVVWLGVLSPDFRDLAPRAIICVLVLAAGFFYILHIRLGQLRSNPLIGVELGSVSAPY